METESIVINKDKSQKRKRSKKDELFDIVSTYRGLTHREAFTILKKRVKKLSLNEFEGYKNALIRDKLLRINDTGQLYTTNPIEQKIRELYRNNKDITDSEVREFVKDILLEKLTPKAKEKGSKLLDLIKSQLLESNEVKS